MKKLFTSLTALVLVSAMVVPVAASAESIITGPEDSGTAVARGVVTGSYTVTIPSYVNINGAPAEVSVTAPNCYVTVTATAANDGAVWTNDTQQGTPVAGVTFTVSTENLTDLTGIQEQLGLVSARWAPDASPSMGTYYGTINFNVAASATQSSQSQGD